MDTLEGETATVLEDSIGWSSTKAITLGYNLYIHKLNSELVYPWKVIISKRKGCSSNHDFFSGYSMAWAPEMPKPFFSAGNVGYTAP